MSNIDPISDLLTRIRNASMRGFAEVTVPHSKIKFEVLKVLKDRKFIGDFEVIPKGTARSEIKVVLRYVTGGKSVISEIERVSTPGRRMYVSYKDIPQVKKGFGVAILSTSKGVLRGDQAIKEKLGGELLCTIW